MRTEIECLRLLERDLAVVASTQETRDRRLTFARKRRTWSGLAAAAAVVLAVAFVVGSIARSVTSETSSGNATAERTAADAPATVTATDDLAGEQFDRGQAGALPWAAPAPSTSASAPEGPASEDLSKIIRDGRIGIVVADGAFRDARNAVTDIAGEANGIVLSSSIDGRSGTFVLRVPASRFDNVMRDVGALGHVDYEEETGQDVTAEYIDLGAHLTIFQDRKALLEELLSQANSVGEILALSGRVEDVQLQIEETQGRLRYLNNQIDESTVRVELRETSAPDEAAVVVDDVTKPSLGRAWQVSVQGFLNVVSAVIVGLGYLLPLGTIALIVWAAISLVHRRERAAT